MNSKKYFIISGLNLYDSNRGTAALGYGALFFLSKFHNKNCLTAAHLIKYRNPWKFNFKSGKKANISVGDETIALRSFYVWAADYWIYKYVPILSRFTKTAQILKKTAFVAAINGGDGFSDIYGTTTFERRLFETRLAMKEHIPLVMLPQTLGPFKDESNFKTAEKILRYASKIYVRDNKFEAKLKSLNVSFKLTKDLSYYMQPEKVDIIIQSNAVGLNISGLCYSNNFRDLSGCFNFYPQLITRIIKHFQIRNIPIFLIAHSYNYKNAEEANDDMLASKEIYNSLEDKTNVYLIDLNLTSPQTKYVISRFNFFIGTRMHANFAAIFMKVPVFGLAYSYKYEGAFDCMGLKGHYASILNIEKDDINHIVKKVDMYYKEAIDIKSIDN